MTRRIGRIRADFTFSPEQGQLATRNGPPLLTTPNRAKLGLDISKDLVEGFKACIAAPPGYVLAEADYTGFHALIVGYLAEDPTYMRLSQLGVHDFLVRLMLKLDTSAHMLGMADDELSKIFKQTKREYPAVRAQAKEVCHGSSYMEGARKIAEMYHLIFNPSLEQAQAQWLETFSLLPPATQPPYVGWWKRVTEGNKGQRGAARKPWNLLSSEDQWIYVDWLGFHAAQTLSNLYHQAFPKIRQWHARMLELAGAPPHCIRTESGSQFWFFDTGGRTSKGDWRAGTDLNNIFSSVVQANAFQHIKEAMIELRERELDKRYGMYLQLHDALHFCLKEKLVEEWKRTIREVMERPSRYMKGRLAPDGLVCKVELMVGRDGASKVEVE